MKSNPIPAGESANLAPALPEEKPARPWLSYLSPWRQRLRRVLPHWGTAMLKAAWAEYSFRSFRPRIVRHRYGPYDFQVELIDYDGALWLDKDYEAGAFAEMEALQRHKLVPGARVFNAGANQGVQAMMMAREVQSGGSVWAIEPNPHNLRAIRRNCELNDIGNVQVIEAAVSSAPGRLWFNRSMNGQVALSQREIGARPVEVVTIDDLSARFGPPDVLYVDVEGFECEVLAGARATLAAHRPDCFVEVHLQIGLERFGGSLEKVLAFFPLAAYDLQYDTGEGGGFRPVSRGSDLPGKRFFLLALARA